MNFRAWLEDITWTHTNEDEDGWYGHLDVNGIRFYINFQCERDSCEVSFWQKGKIIPLDMQTLVAFFQKLDQVLIDFFDNHTNIRDMIVYPHTYTVGRQLRVANRKKDIGNSNFDQAKFNAYQLLFQHSRLHQMGYTMQTRGPELIISRPN